MIKIYRDSEGLLIFEIEPDEELQSIPDINSIEWEPSEELKSVLRKEIQEYNTLSGITRIPVPPDIWVPATREALRMLDR